MSLEWNNLLRWAREERGPYLDPNTLTYQINRSSYSSKANKIALAQQPQIPLKYSEFKYNQSQSTNLQGEYISDNLDSTSLNEGRSPNLNFNISGRNIHTQSQLSNLIANQSDNDNSKGFIGFNHATAANFKPQPLRDLSTPIINPTWVSSLPSTTILSQGNNFSNSQDSSHGIPYPRKGRPKRGNYE